MSKSQRNRPVIRISGLSSCEVNQRAATCPKLGEKQPREQSVAEFAVCEPCHSGDCDAT
jgi:hypothetical protein